MTSLKWKLWRLLVWTIFCPARVACPRFSPGRRGLCKHTMPPYMAINNRCPFQVSLVKIEGTGLNGFDSICQGFQFFQKDTYGSNWFQKHFGTCGMIGPSPSFSRRLPPGSGFCDVLLGRCSRDPKKDLMPIFRVAL